MYKVTKKKVHGLLHPEIVGDERWDKIINVFIIVLIILNVVAVILETVKSINNRYEEFFHYFSVLHVEMSITTPFWSWFLSLAMKLSVLLTKIKSFEESSSPSQ